MGNDKEERFGFDDSGISAELFAVPATIGSTSFESVSETLQAISSNLGDIANILERIERIIIKLSNG